MRFFGRSGEGQSGECCIHRCVCLGMTALNSVLRDFLFSLSMAWYFLSPAVRRRVGPSRTADTAEWCSTLCRTVIFLTNGLRVASYFLEAAFT